MNPNEWKPTQSSLDKALIGGIENLQGSTDRQLTEAIERSFNLRTHNDLIDDLANWIEIGLRKKIRSLSGGDTREFNNPNSYLKGITGKVGFHLRDINYRVCNNPSLFAYIENSIKLSQTEQAIRITILLLFNNEIKKLHFGRRGATLEIATLMCKLGLEKFLICDGES